MIRKLVRRIRSSRIYLECVWQADWLTSRVAALSGGKSSSHHVLLSATGGGNIGDQAMLESFMQNVPGPIAVVTASANKLNIPTAALGRVEIVEIPGLLSDLPIIRLRATVRLIRQLRRAKSYSVIGADIMDGVYSPEQSVARMSSINAALVLGVPARILGFSWSPEAALSAKIAMRRIDGRAEIFVRDPLSMERLKKDGVQGLTATADTVFALAGSSYAQVGEWMDTQRSVGRRLAILNLSGLIANKLDLRDEYQEILRFLRSRGCSVLLLPHVIRPGDDDLAAINAFAASLPENSPEVQIVREVLAPLQVAGLTAKADVVITGRMHLAVLALSSGVPTLTLGTQGKVEGLYALFGLDGYCQQPTRGLAVRCRPILESIVADFDLAKMPITEVLPDVVAAARRNFKDLDPSLS